jgi:hypothetical protein
MANLATKQDTIKLWLQFVTNDCLAYFGLYIAIRHQKWQLRTASLKLMAAVFEALDRPIVTVYEKTQHMGFFEIFEFDASLISSTLELTRVQVLDRSRASLWSYSALFAIVPHPQ